MPFTLGYINNLASPVAYQAFLLCNFSLRQWAMIFGPFLFIISMVIMIPLRMFLPKRRKKIKNDDDDNVGYTHCFKTITGFSYAIVHITRLLINAIFICTFPNLDYVWDQLWSNFFAPDDTASDSF